MPIKKAKLDAANKPKNLLLSKSCSCVKKTAKSKTVKIKVKNMLIPPNEGLDSLLHLIVTSFLLRIPKLLEKRSKSLLMVSDNKNPPIKKASSKI